MLVAGIMAVGKQGVCSAAALLCAMRTGLQQHHRDALAPGPPVRQSQQHSHTKAVET